MFRWLITCLVLCCGAVAGVWYGVPYLQGLGVLERYDAPPAAEGENKDASPQPAEKAAAEIPAITLIKNGNASNRARPLTIQEAHFTVADKQEIPAEHDGPLMVIGTEIQPGEKVEDRKRLMAKVGYLVRAILPEEQVPAAEQITFPNIPSIKRTYRRWNEGDPIKEPATPDGRREGEESKGPFLMVVEQRRAFKRLEVGDEVKAGQMVALVDPTITVKELSSKNAQVNSAEADVLSSMKTKEESYRRFKEYSKANLVGVGKVISEDEVQGAKLTYERYYQEQISKEAAVIKAQQELLQAATVLQKHEVHTTIDGVVTLIYKNLGDAVKNLDPIMQVQSPRHLRIEGLIEKQDAAGLRKGQEVIVEPSRPEQPLHILRGHLQEVTGVAVSAGERPIIVSASEDGTLRGWDLVDGGKLWHVAHKDNSRGRAVACTPKGSKRNLALAGWADGTAWLVNLDNLQERPRPLAERHRNAVTCVAFSPDGKRCATGGDDMDICLWDTEDGKLLYRLSKAHRSGLTAVQFAAGNRLVSAGRDKAMVLWNVAPETPPRRLAESDQRSGEVAQLGVSPDGQRVLFDQGKELRLLSLADRQYEGVVQNPSGSSSFTTMALFAPDGKTILTNVAADGRLQLWRAPDASTPRAAELRQFIYTPSTATPSSATCGAFSPDGRFAVTGTQDNCVLVWPMPSGDEINKKVTARLMAVENFLLTASRQVRIFAELENPLVDVPGKPGEKNYLLTPGGTATLVLMPER